MSAEADLIRCAAPWPGLAAQVLEAFETLGAGEWTPERLCAASIIGMAPGDAIQILVGLRLVGVCDRTPDDSWRSPLSASELRRLATLLRGADHYRRLRLDASRCRSPSRCRRRQTSLRPSFRCHPGSFVDRRGVPARGARGNPSTGRDDAFHRPAGLRMDSRLILASALGGRKGAGAAEH